MVVVQASLGISTLLLYVPVSLATMHQAGSLALLSFSLWLLHTTRDPTRRGYYLQVMQAWVRTHGSRERAAEFLRNQPVGVVQELRAVVRDLAQGRVHRGTAFLFLALVLMMLTGMSAKQLYDYLQEDAEKEKKKKQSAVAST